MLICAATVAADDDVRCRRVAKMVLSGTTITSAEEVAAGDLKLPGNPLLKVDPADAPAFCRLKGVTRPSADSQIGFEVWLPLADWDGRFVQAGNGGLAGSINHTVMLGHLKNRHAVAATDDGHMGAGTDGTWALGHPEKVKDFGHRAVHETSVLAKQIIAEFYGSPAKYSYFNGCSEGGREALMEAQRYPHDSNGILAGAPPPYWTRLMAGFAWNAQALNDSGSFLNEPKRQTVEQAALKACSSPGDGGFIGDPLRCKFDPSELLCKDKEMESCLSKPQLDALKKIYSGAKNPRTHEQLSPGYEPGAEAEPGVPGVSFASYVFGAGPGASLDAMFSTSFYGNFVFQNPEWKFSAFRFDEDPARVEKEVGPILNADNPNLREFRDAGGKLIHYHGWNDGSPPPRQSLMYYEDVVKAMGGMAQTQKFYRLYLAPGMMHCGGGPGPNAFGNMLDPAPASDAEHNIFVALQEWTEKEKAPAKVVATKYKSDNPAAGIALTRPLCAYPQVARWNGKGEASETRNWLCAAPPSK